MWCRHEAQTNKYSPIESHWIGFHRNIYEYNTIHNFHALKFECLNKCDFCKQCVALHASECVYMCGDRKRFVPFKYLTLCLAKHLKYFWFDWICLHSELQIYLTYPCCVLMKSFRLLFLLCVDFFLRISIHWPFQSKYYEEKKSIVNKNDSILQASNFAWNSNNQR